MLICKNINVYNISRAIYSARNPMESWDKSDSDLEKDIIGEKDMRLAQKLILAGGDHRKFMRQILVSMDITASMSAFWDLDTYCVAVAKNSTSRMHKLTGKNCRYLTEEDFNWDHLTEYRKYTLEHINALIYQLKQFALYGTPVMSPEYQAIFTELINDLPEGYLFTRHWTGNYEVIYKLYHARHNHKQEEIRDFCKKLEDLPYFKELILNNIKEEI